MFKLYTYEVKCGLFGYIYNVIYSTPASVRSWDTQSGGRHWSSDTGNFWPLGI